MGHFLLPASGHAGVGHGPTERPNIGPLGKRKKLKDLDRVPPGQFPSAPPPYAWAPLERQDWIPGVTVIESERKFRLIEDGTAPVGAKPTATDPNQARRAMLHAEVKTLRQDILRLRGELKKAIEDSRREREVDRLKNARTVGSPLARPNTIPSQPRATRPFPLPKQEAFGAIAPGTPLHMRHGPMTLGPSTQRIVGLRAEIAKKTMRLAQLRNQIKQITGKSPVFNAGLHRPAPTGAPVQHKVSGVMNVRHQLLGRPRTHAGAPVGPAAQKLKSHGTQWTKKPPEHRTEEHHFRLVSRER